MFTKVEIRKSLKAVEAANQRALERDHKRRANGNKYRVPLKQWRKWSKPARDVFNRTYGFMIVNQHNVKHPHAPALTPAEWKTVSWNTAWIAADAVDDTLPDEIITVTRRRRAA